MSTPVPHLLKSAHRLRKHLRDLQSEIDLGPRVLKIRQQTLAAAEAAHKAAYDTIKALKLKQKEDEGTLKTTEQSLRKYQEQLNAAASKKEFDAKTTEIATATAKKGELEDAILATITEIEERTAHLPTDDATWKQAQAEFADYQREAAERLERLKADQATCTAELATVDAQLPKEMKGVYDRLVKQYGPDGLAGVVGRSCQQCRSALTEQQKNNLTGGSFMTCPNCGRGLYIAD